MVPSSARYALPLHLALGFTMQCSTLAICLTAKTMKEVQTPGSSHGPSTQRSKTCQAQEMYLHFLPISQLEAGVERVRVTHGRSSVPQVNTVLTTDPQIPAETFASKAGWYRSAEPEGLRGVRTGVRSRQRLVVVWVLNILTPTGLQQASSKGYRNLKIVGKVPPIPPKGTNFGPLN